LVILYSNPFFFGAEAEE